MINTERRPCGYVVGATTYKYCRRAKCTNTIPVHLNDNQPEIDYDAVVISKSGGHNRYVFCSDKCASLWLNQKERD